MQGHVKVMRLENHSLQHLRTTEGWMELVNHLEANAGFENISPGALGVPRSDSTAEQALPIY